jgi:hypothetical protein
VAGEVPKKTYDSKKDLKTFPMMLTYDVSDLVQK